MKSLNWDGWSCDGVYELLGHLDWSHKKGTLIVKNSNEIAYIAKGGLLQIDGEGNALSTISEDEVDASVLQSALRKYLQFTITRFINMPVLPSRIANYLAPVDTDGKRQAIEHDDIKAMQASLRIANRRINRVAVAVFNGDISLREALQTAYMCGMCGTCISKAN